MFYTFENINCELESNEKKTNFSEEYEKKKVVNCKIKYGIVWKLKKEKYKNWQDY